VGATRARDHLVVSLHHKEGSRCAAADIWQVTPSDLAVRLEGLVPPDVTADEALGLLPSPPPPDFAGRWEEQRAAAVASHAAFPTLAATEAARVVAGVPADGEPEKEEPEADVPPWQRGRAGTAFGRAVHAVLQTVDLATGEGVAAAAAAQAVAEGIPDRADDVARATRSALQSPAAREAASSPAWREVYVAAEVGGAVVEGFVDLLYEAPEGLVVVDWKTDRVGTLPEVDAAVARYRVQAAAYALALERTLSRPVARCELVFTTAGEQPVQRRVAQLDEAKALVEGVALSLSGPRPP
jgi:ATP-dependent helicase/nuclease subunit A